KAATSVIPTVFMVSDDPVKLGLVASLSRPGGNATGVNYFISELAAKRLSLLRELLPAAVRIGALVNPNAATTEGFTKDVMAAASAISIQVEIVQARDSREIEAAFATLAHSKVDALMVAPDTLFATGRASADRHFGNPPWYSRDLYRARVCGEWRLHELPTKRAGCVSSACDLRGSYP